MRARGWEPARRRSPMLGGRGPTRSLWGFGAIEAGAALLVAAGLLVLLPSPGSATTYYVRQTVGNDANDGLSPRTAWRSILRLGAVMRAGDTVYVGPGLYREEIWLDGPGTAEGDLTFIADTTGQHTGDPPGVVMIAGAEPVDSSIFSPYSAPGVYMARFPTYIVHGVVEMDGPQRRYMRLRETKEFAIEKMPELEIVAKYPSSYHYDEHTGILYIHTSDGKAPSTHEIELIRRGDGIYLKGKHQITVIGFTFRHMGDAGIGIWGSRDIVAIDNVSYGSRQGIRVYGATNVLLYGNTLFRNENSGAYFAAGSVNGKALRNIAFENIKGLRWSSQSVHALALDNVLFDNLERGLAVEHADGAVLRRNRLVNNATSQLLVIQTQYDSDANCFDNGAPNQLAVDFYILERYKTLVEYQTAKHQDQHSREGGCGPLPEKPDVHRLQAEAMAYVERARKELGGSQ
jgi:parallel beta-helix repeat protein